MSSWRPRRAQTSWTMKSFSNSAESKAASSSHTTFDSKHWPKTGSARANPLPVSSTATPKARLSANMCATWNSSPKRASHQRWAYIVLLLDRQEFVEQLTYGNRLLGLLYVREIMMRRIKQTRVVFLKQPVALRRFEFLPVRYLCKNTTMFPEIGASWC